MEIAGRSYAIPAWLERTPLVVICIDGCDPSYIRHATGGKMFVSAAPKLVSGGVASASAVASQGGNVTAAGQVILDGFVAYDALCVMPSFTNANNVSIVTGAPPSVHGVSGNHYFDKTLGKERPMNEASDIRPLVATLGSRLPTRMYHGTILSALEDATDGKLRVAAVTSKNKLFNLLQRGFTAQDKQSNHPTIAGQAAAPASAATFISVEQLKVNMYSKEATIRLLAEGFQLMQPQNSPNGASTAKQRPHVAYLSSTDYMQHKHGPNAPDMTSFMDELFAFVHRLQQEANCLVCITADHGMSAKPTIAFMTDALVAQRVPRESFRVVLPITDPYVAHHAALGSYCTVSLVASAGAASTPQQLQDDASALERLLAAVRTVKGVRLALPRAEAAVALSIPSDSTVGDIVVVMDEAFAVGKGAQDHDLRQLEGIPLRSHGGSSEQHVPLLMDRRLDVSVPLAKLRAERGEACQLRNFDIFYLALNASVVGSSL